MWKCTNPTKDLWQSCTLWTSTWWRYIIFLHFKYLPECLNIKKCNFLWTSLVTPVSISHGWLLVHAARLWTSCGWICFNGLATHAHVGVVTSSWHSSDYHLPARPQVMWPTCVGLKAAAALTGEQQDQPTAPPCTITRRTGRISRVRRRGGFAFRGGRSKPPRDPVCRSAGSTDALMPLHWKQNGFSWRTSD